MINDENLVRDLFTLGGSAGGIEAVIGVLRHLPSDFPGTVGVALHRSSAAGSQLAAVLGRHAPLPVREPSDGEPVKAGHIYLAPTDFHMTIEDERWRLSRGPKMHRMRPSVDPLMISAAMARGNRVVGVLLSGGGVDGVEGLIAITGKGGLSIAQAPEQARQPSMPATAIREDDVSAVLGIDEIGAVLPLLAAGRAIEVSRSRRAS